MQRDVNDQNKFDQWVVEVHPQAELILKSREIDISQLILAGDVVRKALELEPLTLATKGWSLYLWTRRVI